MRIRRALVLLFAFASMPACDGGSTKPPELETIEVSSAGGQTTIMLGETLQLTATGKDQNGDPFTLANVTWSTSNAQVATVSNNGLVSSVGGGSVVITATSGNVSGALELDVAGSIHSSDITTSQTWRAVDNPHFVTAEIEVTGSGSPVLTIEPGVVVRFAAGTGLWIGGSAPGAIMANGTAAAPITMVADAASPAKGFWDGVTFIRNAGSSELHYVTMSNCGGGGSTEAACLHIGDANAPSQVPKVLVDNVTIQNSAGYGVFVKNGAGFKSGSSTLTVSGSNKPPVHITANEIGDLPAGGSFTGNTPNVIEIRDSRVTTTQTWPQLGIPYVALVDIIVEGAGGPVLTLPAGTQIRMEAGRSFTVGTCGAGGAGTLIANGTAASPIRFTSNATVPAAGDWGQLYIACTASANTRVSNAIVEYGGGTSPYAAFAGNVMVEQDIGAFLTNTTMRFSEDCGVVRRSPLVTWTTDYTAAAHGNTFTNNPRTQCGP